MTIGVFVSGCEKRGWTRLGSVAAGGFGSRRKRNSWWRSEMPAGIEAEVSGNATLGRAVRGRASPAFSRIRAVNSSSSRPTAPSATPAAAAPAGGTTVTSSGNGRTATRSPLAGSVTIENFPR